MKKLSKKLLSILLAASMILTMLPAAAMADTIADFSIDEPEKFTLGNPDAEHHLYIINDAEIPMRYEITLNDDTQQTAIKANSYLSIGINEGDTYSVKKLGNANYTVISESANFNRGEYDHEIGNEFSHKFGTGFKVGEKYRYTNKYAEFDEKDVEVATAKDIKGTYVIKGSVVSCTASIKSTSKSSATVVVGNYQSTVSGNFTNTTKSVVTNNASLLQAAADKLFADNYLNDYVYKAYGYEQKSATFSGAVTGLIFKSASYSVSGSYLLYCPLTRTVEDVVDELEPGDITLTYTSETEAKTGGVAIDILNNERITAIDEAINDDFITNLVESGMLDSLMPNSDKEASAEKEEFTADDFVELLQKDEVANFIDIAALDNMPTGYTVTLKEIDQNDGLFEGLEYEVPYESKLFFTLDIEKILKDALGNLYSLVSGSIGEKYSNLVLELPISVGASFKLPEGIRAGKYQLSIKSPGSGWVAANGSTFNIEVKGGQVTTDIGGTHQSGIIHLKTVAPLLLEQVGCGGCSWLLGMCSTVKNGSAKIFNQSGVLYDHNLNNIEFTNADLVRNEDGVIQTVGIEGSTFLLIDRDRMVALARALYAMGESAVNSITGGISYDDIPSLILKLTDTSRESTDNGIDTEALLVSIIAMGDELGGFNIPSILEATGDEDGLVRFTPKNNVTLKKLAELVPQAYGLVTDIEETADQIEEILPDIEIPEVAPLNATSLFDLPSLQSLKLNKAPATQSLEETAVEENLTAETPEETPAESSKIGNPEPINIGGQDMTLVLEVLSTVGDADNINVMKNLIKQVGELEQSDDEGTETTDPTQPAGPTEPTAPAEQEEQGGQEEQETPVDPIVPEETDSVQAAMELIEKLGGTDIGFAASNMIGLSDGRFPVSNYILIQTDVPEGHFVNPIIYTFKNMWNASDRVYETFASIDLGDLMSDEQFAAFAERLAESSESLAAIFEDLALGVDTSLGLMRSFIGTGEGYDSDALLTEFERLAAELAEANGEEPVEEDPVEEVVIKDAVVEEEKSLETEVPEKAEDPKTGEIRKALTDVVNEVVAAYIPKAVIISYISNMLYLSTGDLFESADEAASVLIALIEDKDFTLTNLFESMNKLLRDADYILNGKVTKNWYFYNLSTDVFSDADIAMHYVLSEMLPAELATVIERAIANDLDVAEEVIESIINPEGSEEDPEVPVEANTPDITYDPAMFDVHPELDPPIEQEKPDQDASPATQQEQTKAPTTEPATTAPEQSKGTSTGSSLINGITEGVETVVDTVGSVVGGVVNTVGGLIDGIGNLFKK